MKKYILLLIIAGFAMSCNKDFDSLNTNIKKPKDVDPAFLFSGAQRQLSDVLTNNNVNFNIFRLTSQYWTETTYTDESNYDLNTRNIPQNFWNQMYVDVIKGFTDSEAQLKRVDPNLSSADSKNKFAMTEVMIAYSYAILVNTYGNVPYSEALDINNVYPKYDDAATVYGKLIERLDAALASFDESAGSYDSGDLMLKGDIAKWKIFTNSIKLKLGMMLADSDPATAQSVVAAAAPNVMSSSADNVIFRYFGSPPNTNPIWVDLVQSNRKDFVASQTIVDAMVLLEDPRIPAYFTTDAAGGYSGGPHGDNNNYATYSKPGSRLIAQDFESIIMDYSEISFLLAEAVERGFIGGSAEQHYNEGIKESMRYWGFAGPEVNTYMLKPEVAYATAAGDWKQKIGTQKWLALYNRGFDAWTEIRRLDYPQLPPPADPVTDFPVRYTYPVQEQNLNTEKWSNAASAIGGDKVTTKLFWDKF